jgi:ABC-type Mn2+/Zn2+ transport system permease subunit
VPSKPPSPWTLIGVGSAMATSVAGGLVLGFFVDKRELTLPVFTFVGLAVGILVACLYAYAKFRKFWS